MSGPFPLGSTASPEKLKRDVAEAAPLFTSVNVVIQFSCAARCAMEPMTFRLAIEGACCSTSKATPATVKFPERSTLPLAATRKLTTPLPVPEKAPLKETNGKVLVALHAQPVGAVMLMVPVPPAAVNACPPGLIA